MNVLGPKHYFEIDYYLTILLVFCMEKSFAEWINQQIETQSEVSNIQNSTKAPISSSVSVLILGKQYKLILLYCISDLAYQKAQSTPLAFKADEG